MSHPTSSAGSRLARELLARLGIGSELESLASRSWTSITFSGERHRLRVRLHGPGAAAAADAFRAQAGELELDMPGHLLVDIEMVGEERRPDGSVCLELQAVTLQAG